MHINSIQLNNKYNGRQFFKSKKAGTVKPQNQNIYEISNKTRNNSVFSQNIQIPIKLEKGQILALNGVELHNRNSTVYFRQDIDWAKFGEYLKEKYKDANRVNTYIWGCSKGCEAYSLAIILKREFKNEINKFCPIEAMDIMPSVIEKNIKRQQSKMNIDFFDIRQILQGLDNEYINDKEIEDYIELNKYSLNRDILDSVNFSVSNIVTDLDKIDTSNPSIIMCRNMWPYINPDEYDKCAKKMYEKLSPGSIVVIGHYDCTGEQGYADSYTFPKYLVENNFKPNNSIQGRGYQHCNNKKDKAYFLYEK